MPGVQAVSESIGTVGGLDMRSFAGGAERGPCVQFTLPGGAFVQLTRAEVVEVASLLSAWERSSHFCGVPGQPWRRSVPPLLYKTDGSIVVNPLAPLTPPERPLNAGGVQSQQDEFSEARAGDMEAAILDAIEALAAARSGRGRATGRSGELLEQLGDRLLFLMDAIDDTRNGRA
jgi:hypothetical protein